MRHGDNEGRKIRVLPSYRGEDEGGQRPEPSEDDEEENQDPTTQGMPPELGENDGEEDQDATTQGMRCGDDGEEDHDPSRRDHEVSTQGLRFVDDGGEDQYPSAQGMCLKSSHQEPHLALANPQTPTIEGHWTEIDATEQSAAPHPPQHRKGLPLTVLAEPTQ
ncbi:hypothetical protein EJ08DRAFT_98014 [Tothia fuscella]|uniref:Uncharacterized protein n=1 Tax=Tothia fuscella TaxID=1048955 RepID=A0A9P4NEG8_9PEZI|nr:hypothetical protein EJ08DRAFT_98014 [Tothia fuscella]